MSELLQRTTFEIGDVDWQKTTVGLRGRLKMQITEHVI